MKRLLFLFLISFHGFSQTIEYKTFTNKFEEFDYYAKPNKNNNLSRYFESNIDTRLLKALKFRNPDNNKKRIFLTFRLNKNNKVIGIRVNSQYSELDNSISAAFKKYDIEKLNIPEKNTQNIYALQIISKEDDEAIVNCSTNIVYDRYPVFEGCESITSYNKMRRCINKELESHVIKSISPMEIKEAKILGDLNLEMKFIIDETGVVKNIKSKTPTESLTNELNRIIAQFPKAKIPPFRNGKPTRLFYKTNILLLIDSKDSIYQDDVEKANNTLLLNPNNQLALHFKKYISDKELKNIIFPIKQKHIKVFFSVNKKGEPIEVKTNSKDLKLNSKIVRIFKEFPFEKLNINSSNVLDLYSYHIISKEYDKNVIKCNDKPSVTTLPFFNKKCEKSKTPSELKKCFSNNMSNILIRKFDRHLRHKTTLTGDIKIRSSFVIDTLGKIINVKVKAPNPFLANEIERIIKTIPNVYKPSYFNGKPKNYPFSLPIRFRIKGDDKPEDPFKSPIRKGPTHQKINGL